MAIGENAMTLNVQFRVEELRKSDSDADDSESASDEAGAEARTDHSLDIVDDDLDIPGLRDLTVEVLGRIHKALEEWKSIGQRYGVAAGNKKMKSLDQSLGASEGTSKESVANISTKQSGKEKEISDRTRFATKLRWAIKDKTTLEELLAQLTSLNDSLEKLLPRRQRANLARGLAGEILNFLEAGGAESCGADIDEQLSKLSGADEAKAARIVRLKRSNFTEKDERVPKDKDGSDSQDAAKGPTPFSKYVEWAGAEPGSMQIPFDHFVKLPEPKIQYHEVQKPGRGLYITGKYVPLQRSVAVYVPSTSPTSGSSAPGSDGPAQATLVEWRPAAHETRASKLSEDDLKTRRDHVARLLHRTSVVDVDFRVLDCLGYTSASAHTPEGATHTLVGYLQCAGWVHRKISSYNIIFFKDRRTEELDLSHPFLTGWQYSRPDDQRYVYASEGSLEGIGDLDMYVHRARLQYVKGRFPRFRKSFDIYSIGVVLMEIAFWEPIIALAPEEQRENVSQLAVISSGSSARWWWEAILKTAKKELAPEMGDAYRDAVLFCLNASGEGFDEKQGFWEEERNSRDLYYVETGFEEVGIEKDFFGVS
ncbi:hypothetical protein LAWI1_G006474 [Lachnellula willkommii]|uniref:Prion-inhibition and propagation HeLo domain-containing protein n=1 Tax=Lachnellula willkommii TaxID=215461 RepID=A0A559MDI8_9HELO|nr:hypothetical protein LAWI1_G006474 [Lachnellula willkommii]